jgi:maltose alpha-D-glucosyltransferase / alpha-amylase
MTHIPWYKDAIVYGLDVKSFYDGNGDGMGDFPGLIEKLPYLAELGVTCLWLSPFYPSPLKDNGYDVADYCNIDPRLGTLDDFRTFMRAAKRLKLHIIVDMVANHTSDQHPWFQAARKDKNSPYRDYYVWAEAPVPGTEDQVIFPGVETSTWEYDPEAGAYYFHYFYKFQPGLNHKNPAVREEFRKIMGFWLDLGVDGFRIDAAPLLISHKGTPNPRKNSRHDILQEMRAYVEGKNPEAVLVAEADAEFDHLDEFFGGGKEMNILFNFALCSHLFLSMAKRDSAAIDEVLDKLPEIPMQAEWLNFLRNLDELNLERLNEAHRKIVFEKYAPDEDMRIYGRGIRRRLAPMLDGDGGRRQLQMIYAVLFSFAGIPLLMYGDEIGMGDNLALKERESCRTPMQWANTRNGGFSPVPEEQLFRPVIKDGDYGYPRVNAADQEQDPESLLNWMKKLIEARKGVPEFGRGVEQFIATDKPYVFALCCEWEGQQVIAIHNLSDQPCRTKCASDLHEGMRDIFSDAEYPPVQGTEVELNGFGYRWLR